MALIKGFINQGLTFEQIRDEIVEICYILAEGEEVRGDILCPGAVDIQGPHVSIRFLKHIQVGLYHCHVAM